MSDEQVPHPFGAILGPSAIHDRRRTAVLAGEVVRLLEGHGVRWSDAVRETAGLFGMTIREVQEWWCFEMCDHESPTDNAMIATKLAEEVE